ncbi:helix-turn-helix transcriptional regulator [Nocardioides limicola]|uniref:helix-turn-helix transcriptional regulator n=1 Tax=Nocardioides limicola TaxID=2803368 RepID=UPI00193B660C|nr:helix-turn-helix transcriptional regulator [Nocardioides sp. DJM-14]
MSNDLGTFLRARRADAGLEPSYAATGRRRVTGLRREEVATLAGISVDYYTRLEQGREANPSDSVLEALARVLNLESDAVDHLYALRGNGAPEPRQDLHPDTSTVERMTALVKAVRPNPAYVLDRLSNIVASNKEGLALFDGLDERPPHQRNTCRYLMTHPRARDIFLDWEDIARGAVAHLRAANAHDLDDEHLQDLVAELSDQSDHFAEWWAGHIVERRRSAAKRIRSSAGVQTRRYEVLHLPEERLRMTIWLLDD